MTSVKDTAKRQFIRILDQASHQMAGVNSPREGWINLMRKALGMSAPQLARRIGVTKAAIYQAERKEIEGGVTLQHIAKLAEAMGGRFVYAIVPNGNVEDVLRAQALTKAKTIIGRAGGHMALEQQALSSQQLHEEIERLSDELLREFPSDFWEDT